MEWETDRSLQLRMVATLALIAALPLAFTATMSAALNHIVLPLAESLTETEGSYGTISFDPRIVLALTLVGMVLAAVKGGDAAVGSAHARTVSSEEAPDLHGRVQRLAATAEMQAPDVAITDSSVPNAFATGGVGGNGTIAVTSGLRETLEDDELDAVLAHELAHLRNRDATVMSIAYLLPTFTYVVSMVTYKVLEWFLHGVLRSGFRTSGRRDGRAIAVAIVLFVVTAIVTITVSVLFWAASFVLFRLLSQYREYAADRGAAAITGDPLALASALETIDDEMSAVPDRDLRDLDGGVEALYISPLDIPMFNDEDDEGLVSQDLFPDSHPPTGERIERLRDLAGTIES